MAALALFDKQLLELLAFFYGLGRKSRGKVRFAYRPKLRIRRGVVRPKSELNRTSKEALDPRPRSVAQAIKMLADRQLKFVEDSMLHHSVKKPLKGPPHTNDKSSPPNSSNYRGKTLRPKT